MKLVLIHAGAFTMGSPVSEEGRSEDETPHEVTISKSFYLGVYEEPSRKCKRGGARIIL